MAKKSIEADSKKLISPLFDIFFAYRVMLAGMFFGREKISLEFGP